MENWIRWSIFTGRNRTFSLLLNSEYATSVCHFSILIESLFFRQDDDDDDDDEDDDEDEEDDSDDDEYARRMNGRK